MPASESNGALWESNGAVGIPVVEVKHGTIVPRDVLGSDAFDEPYSLEYLPTPMDVEETVLADQTRQYRAVSRAEPLDGQGLFNMLQHIAPEGRGEAPGVAASDWDLPDRGGKAGTHSHALMALHSHLGAAWTDFMHSRPAYLEMIRQADQPPLSTRAGSPWPVAEVNDLSLPRISRHVAECDPHPVQTFTKLVDTAGVAKGESIIMNCLIRAINRGRRNSLSNPDNILRRFDSLNTRHKADMLIDILRPLPKRQKEELREAAMTSLYERLETDGGVFYALRGPEVEASSADAPEQATEALPLLRGLLRTSDPMEKWDKSVTLPPTLRHLAVSTMDAEIKWTVDASGNRRFELGQTVDKSTAAPRYTDSVAGVQLAAYLSPEIHETWAAKSPMKLKGAKVLRDGQPISVAQIPVFTLLPHWRSALLGSRIVSSLEAAAE